MYQLEDEDVEQALVQAEGRRVTVRVILDQNYHSLKSYQYLQARGVAVRWATVRYAITHQKTLVVDDKTAVIMTFNLRAQFYSTSRDFGLVDCDPADVTAIEQTFAADWQDRSLIATSGDNLVWSPGSAPALLTLIDHAQTSLEIYNEEMADDRITAALAQAARRGVRVRVVMTEQSDWDEAFAHLRMAGAEVHTYPANANLYIHAKMVLADSKTAFVGSENFSDYSLDKNRELGLIIHDSSVIKALSAVFESDFAAVAKSPG